MSAARCAVLCSGWDRPELLLCCPNVFLQLVLTEALETFLTDAKIKVQILLVYCRCPEAFTWFNFRMCSWVILSCLCTEEKQGCCVLPACQEVEEAALPYAAPEQRI